MKIAVKFFITGFLTILAIYIPFLIADGHENILDGIKFESTDRDPAGLSLTSIFYRIDESFVYLSILFPTIYIIYAVYESKQIKNTNGSFLDVMCPIFMKTLTIFYLFSKSLHIQYFLWVLPFYFFHIIRFQDDNRNHI